MYVSRVGHEKHYSHESVAYMQCSKQGANSTIYILRVLIEKFICGLSRISRPCELLLRQSCPHFRTSDHTVKSPRHAEKHARILILTASTLRFVSLRGCIAARLFHLPRGHLPAFIRIVFAGIPSRLTGVGTAGGSPPPNLLARALCVGRPVCTVCMLEGEGQDRGRARRRPVAKA